MNSFLGWVGGKKLLREAIITRFPADSFKKYVEVFGGAGWVLFARDRHAETEVYNDVNSNLTNLFRIVKYHPDALEQELDGLLNARETFEIFRHSDGLGLTDIQRAARFLYLIRLSYGAKGADFWARGRSILREGEFDAIAKRLSQVVVENMGFDKLILRYDGEGTLFYLDPPYVGAEGFYKKQGYAFTDADHRELNRLLRAIKGRFILSYNDCKFVRELYNGFNIEPVSRQNNLASRYEGSESYKELIVRNY
jgi:DNA adenine methylase